MIWKRTTFDVTEHDGNHWLCVKFETVFTDKPTKVIHWWPICLTQKDQTFTPWPNIVGAEAHQADTGAYTWYRDGGAFNYETFRLVNGGSTLPIKTVQRDVPCPKLRRETRWHWGWWQQYLKTRGWENLPMPETA